MKEKEGYKKLDDIFLALEGSAMWAQFKLMRKNAPAGQTPEQTLHFLFQQGDSWVQEEGLAIFLSSTDLCLIGNRDILKR